jgi:hypothetical protein
MALARLTSADGPEYRDLNHNGRMDPFEDPGCRSRSGSSPYSASSRLKRRPG